jgi:hypothetical protein
VEVVELPPVVATLEEEVVPEWRPALDDIFEELEFVEPWEPALLELVLDSPPPGVLPADVPQCTSHPAQAQRIHAVALTRAAARGALRNLPGRRVMATRSM